MGATDVWPTPFKKESQFSTFFYSTKVFEELFLKTIISYSTHIPGPKGMTEIGNKMYLIHLHYRKVNCVKFTLNLL